MGWGGRSTERMRRGWGGRPEERLRRGWGGRGKERMRRGWGGRINKSTHQFLVLNSGVSEVIAIAFIPSSLSPLPPPPHPSFLHSTSYIHTPSTPHSPSPGVQNILSWASGVRKRESHTDLRGFSRVTSDFHLDIRRHSP